MGPRNARPSPDKVMFLSRVSSTHRTIKVLYFCHFCYRLVGEWQPADNKDYLNVKIGSVHFLRYSYLAGNFCYGFILGFLKGLMVGAPNKAPAGGGGGLSSYPAGSSSPYLGCRHAPPRWHGGSLPLLGGDAIAASQRMPQGALPTVDPSYHAR